MDIFVMPVYCSVCGGEGRAKYCDGGAWLNSFVHSDSRVCEENIKRQKAKAEAENKKLKQELEKLQAENARGTKAKLRAENKALKEQLEKIRTVINLSPEETRS